MKCYSVINWSQQTLAEFPSRILWIISLIIYSGTLPNISFELTNLEWQNILSFFWSLFLRCESTFAFSYLLFSLYPSNFFTYHCPHLHIRILHTRVWFAHSKELKLIFSSKITSYTISFHLHFFILLYSCLFCTV